MRRLAVGSWRLAVALLITTSLFAQARDYRDIKTPPLRAFNPPAAKRIQLANGMVIFLMEDHELPLIRGTARIRGGGRNVPVSKAGLMGIYGGSWRTGGTKDKTGDQLDELLESRAAVLETGGGEDSTNIRFDVLKNDLDFVFPIFLELLRNPQFRQEKIDLAKTQTNTGISRRNDDPGSILNREAAKLAYGADSPYARQAEYATVASITRDDLLAFHKQYVHPNNIIMGVVGDFDSKAMEKRLRDAFGSWARGPQVPPPPPEGTPAKPGIYFVNKDDVTQTNIAMVGRGITRKDPDFYKVVVLNNILSGGSFSGRLINNLRTKRGLAYSVSGQVGVSWDHLGMASYDMGTKSGSTIEALQAMRQELQDVRTQPFTEEELQLAKEFLLNVFVFTMDSPEKILGQQINLEFHGFPLDHFRTFPSFIQKVTLDDVTAAAKKYIHPDQLATLVVGREKDFDKPLSTLGNVTTIDITIPEPGAAPTGAKPAAGNEEGAALAKKVADFVGGTAKLSSIKALRANVAMSMKGPQGMMDTEMDALTRYPSDLRLIMKMPMGEVTMVVTSDTGFVLLPGGASQELPGSQRESMRNDEKSDIVTILRNLGNPAYKFTAAGTEKVGDVEGRIVEINADGVNLKWVVDPSTGRLLRRYARGRMGAEQITDYQAWKEFGGLRLPSAFTVTANGEVVGKAEVKSMEVDPVVDPSVFVKK